MQRTGQQNNALHLWLGQVADAMNNAGYDLKAVLEAKPIPVSCTKENMKQNVFKPIMRALYPQYTSTTQLEKIEVSDVYEHMNRWLAQEFGISVPFPSEETPYE